MGRTIMNLYKIKESSNKYSVLKVKSIDYYAVSNLTI